VAASVNSGRRYFRANDIPRLPRLGREFIPALLSPNKILIPTTPADAGTENVTAIVTGA